ncbi:hypothetical protein [Cellulomonas sp. ATA003]|uniref:hypothetical protein n=1 Tax=Cellulomonas sp. ATA003 TaxID=3073064 RepID=UPI002873C7AC|nr:hypothetical protein [Cellulomonas sp. ATA003]WNB87289.1 hypothetical protein REH70_09415 [Cellulomonas sp. ATA003]
MTVEGDEPPTIVVGDTAVRSYLWRLLAAGGARTAVLNRAERDAAGGGPSSSSGPSGPRDEPAS